MNPDSGEQWIVGDVDLALKIVRGVIESGDRAHASVVEGAAR